MDKPNYGIDAPGDLRRLVFWGVLLVLAAVGVKLLDVAPLRAVASGCLWTGCVMLAVSALMLLSSLVLKFGVRDRLLRDLDLNGDERVLDVGCGRGLALIGAAKRLTTGHATGIDLWSAEDLSANTAEATLANAALEGVADRITVDTGDMRALPYADARFDAVISMTAIHNIKEAAGRQKAFEEIVRVLKPGGRLALFDIFHPFAYPAILRSLDVEGLRVSGPILLWAVPGIRLFARKRPLVTGVN